MEINYLTGEKATVRGDKKESQHIRWLQAHAEKLGSCGGRPALAGIYVEDDLAVASDGFKMAIVKTPDCLKTAKGKIVTGKVPAGDFVAELDVVDATYPPWRQIVPIGDAEYAISISPDHLRTILGGMDTVVHFVFRKASQAIEIMGKDKQGNPVYVLLMPMHRGDNWGEPWRPFDPTELAEERKTEEARRQAEYEAWAMRNRIAEKLAKAEQVLAEQKGE